MTTILEIQRSQEVIYAAGTEASPEDEELSQARVQAGGLVQHVVQLRKSLGAEMLNEVFPTNRNTEEKRSIGERHAGQMQQAVGKHEARATSLAQRKKKPGPGRPTLFSTPQLQMLPTALIVKRRL